ncbi:Glycosyltransferase involved in cell wall bisynthesis [Desulfocicer vacuolatum DSM 3385]|uniref:Glycosyltransferase involved in cell wall bisynthesis n=1 Tax=Desulfocicer vacuolatum DSM 3385 TaxID=1121400 RepID=A0A1W1ZBI1_9BACT|nr:glycosyltransferase family 4 protein [Desulfocicer vacuolatum]SMC45770.1 Glycosyltransferase involved in cell wall bisynthesis [Desulfocicer vacuolatum DSM 3385]
MKKRPYIIFLAKRQSSASTRYRALNYFPFLKQAGFYPVHMDTKGSCFHKLTILREVKKSDAVVVIRKTFSLPFRIVLQLLSIKLIFDFDDAVFVKSNGKNSRLRKGRFKSMLKAVDHVWAGNEYLAENAKKWNASVDILPTAVDLNRYKKVGEKSKKNIDIVWIGSSSTKKYLQELVPILEILVKRSPHIRLKIIADFDLETKNLTTLPIDWSNDTEVDALSSSHIGISMMSDDAWSRGKCGLKVLQYMSSSLPVVVSNVGVHREIVVQGKSGFLVNDESEWLSALSSLINDEQLRLSMGKYGQQIVKKRYNYEATSRSMIKLLQNIDS